LAGTGKTILIFQVGNESVDFNLITHAMTPETTTMLLLGLGLIWVAGARSKLKSKLIFNSQQKGRAISSAFFHLRK
jgi:hypothetical protein